MAIILICDDDDDDDDDDDNNKSLHDSVMNVAIYAPVLKVLVIAVLES
jgi:hypothetical protein